MKAASNKPCLTTAMPIFSKAWWAPREVLAGIMAYIGSMLGNLGLDTPDVGSRKSIYKSVEWMCGNSHLILAKTTAPISRLAAQLYASEVLSTGLIQPLEGFQESGMTMTDNKY